MEIPGLDQVAAPVGVVEDVDQVVGDGVGLSSLSGSCRMRMSAM